MAIDTSIFSQIRQPEAPNLLGQYAQFQQLQAQQDQNRLAQLAFQDRERQQADQMRLRGIYAANPDGGAGLENALLRGGFADQALKFGTDRRANAKSDADTQATQIATATKKLEAVGQGLGFLKDNPSIENAQALIATWQQAGLMTPEEAQQKLVEFGRDPTPQGVQRLALMGYQGALSAKDQLAQYTTQNNGATTSILATNPVTSQVRTVNTTQNTVSPDAQLQASTTRRGQDLTDTRERELGAASREAQQSVYDSERGVVVNKATGLARPAATMDGKSLPAKLPDATKKELASIDSQISVIDGALKDVRGTPDAFSFQRGLATMTGPLAESVAGRFDSSAQRDARSYVFNVVSKVINERAGAAQSAQELARLRSFLPAETDNAQQVADKLESFKGYLADVGNGLQAGRYNPQPKPGAGGESAPARITDDAGFNALPSGALFIGPDGKTRRKP